MTAQLATHCQQISDYISLDGNDAILLEVGSSLRYFGNLNTIRKRIESVLAGAMEATGSNPAAGIFHAVSPSANASLLLARSGHNIAIGHEQDLRSKLGGVTTDALAIDLRTRQKLKRCGLFHLRDIWRLPLPELRIRFGRELTDYLEHCLAQKPEQPPRWQAALVYEDQYDADHGLHSLSQILHVGKILLDRFELFLRKHHMSSDQLVWQLDHGTGETVAITLQIRKAHRDARLFLLLLETRLSTMRLVGEINTITLSASQFTAYVPEGSSWPSYDARTQRNPDTDANKLLDQLAAKLGHDRIQRLLLRHDYCPEFATHTVSYLTPSSDEEPSADKKPSAIHLQPDSILQSPCWLLKPPQALHIRNHRLYYQSSLTLLRGPRRIETRWWEEQGVRRDYYVAANEEGHLLWIFQDLNHQSAQQGKRTGWFLQGLFG